MHFRLFAEGFSMYYRLFAECLSMNYRLQIAFPGITDCLQNAFPCIIDCFQHAFLRSKVQSLRSMPLQESQIVHSLPFAAKYFYHHAFLGHKTLNNMHFFSESQIIHSKPSSESQPGE
jgi:hypothetical protein